jgi:hypothetical protein
LLPTPITAGQPLGLSHAQPKTNKTKAIKTNFMILIYKRSHKWTISHRKTPPMRPAAMPKFLNLARKNLFGSNI